MIDPHVHTRDWDQSEKETMRHALSVASLGGFSTLFDMPNTSPPLTFPHLISKRLEEGLLITKELEREKGVEMHYCVYGGLTSDPSQIETLVTLYRHLFPHLIGFKLFAGHSTGNMGVTTVHLLREVYGALKRSHYKGVLAVHCEDESLIRNDLFTLENPISHTIARPKEAEISSLEQQIALCKETSFEGTLHICHISTKEAIEMVNYHKGRGMNITCGATPHHALLDESLMETQGLLAKMNPPLRSKEDCEAVFNGLIDGSIDWIESDHAPHTIEDKLNGASGIPGFGGTLTLIRRLRESGVEEEHLDSLLGNRVNEVYHTDFPVMVPSNLSIDEVVGRIIGEYPFTIF
ncbi:MAG: dihydroorotase [Spirochaetia bacterium]|nr:dihydroorotase [Spirochaetia bacterium]